MREYEWQQAWRSSQAGHRPADAQPIAEAVIQHLSGLCDVEITLEISAQIPTGAPDNVVRTVSEPCRTLKFKTFEFEES